jgi:HAE1 family hydrophobic/amphiphilic exporter-1
MAILVSGLVSLSLTPMMASRFLKETKRPLGKDGKPQEGGALWQGIVVLYEWGLKLCLRHRLVTMVVFFILLGGTAHYFMIMPKGFIPSEDRGYIFGYTLAEEGISFEGMSQKANALAAIVARDPAVEGVMSVVGASFAAMNSSIMFAHLKERDLRDVGPDQVIARLRPQLYMVPGILAFLQNPPPIELTVQQTRAPYQYTLQSPETDVLYKSSFALLQKMRTLNQIIDVNSDLMISSPELTVDIDRDRASSLGITAQQIEDAIYSGFADRRVSYIYASDNTYKVIVELLPEYQREPDDLSWIYLPSRKGKMTPLSEVVEFKKTLGPLQINHVGQLPSVTISFNTRPGVSLGEATDSVQKVAAEVLPATITGSFKGQAEEFQKSMSSLYWLLVLALAVIYLILGVLYESFIHPITILAGLPSAALGALITLDIFGAELNLYAFVGIIMLVGIVKKNAIMMIDFALEAERKEGKSPRDAIYEGAVVRFRPIMMTTVAAFVGILPIAIGFGAGGEARQPLGLAVCGGLVVSQAVTMLITPVIYTYFDQLQNWLGGKKEKNGQTEVVASS